MRSRFPDAVLSLARRIFTLDLRSLALCRIGTGLVVLGDLLTRAQSFRIHYTDDGILPRQALFELNILRFPSLYAASGWEPFLAGLFVLHAMVAVMLLLGYRTRLAGVLLWYLTHSLQQRLQLANNGGDTVLISVLFWGMFLPWGEALSVDAEARRARGEPEPADRVLSAATVVFCLQPLVMYYVSVLAKMEPDWLRGDVLLYAFRGDFYARPLSALLLPYEGALKALAYATLAWESLGPLMLLSPHPRARGLACLLFAVMHLSFGLFLRIGIFAFTPLLYLAGYLPTACWRERAFPSGLARFCRRVASALPPAPERPVRLGRASSGLLGLLFCYTLLTSLSEDPRIGRILPHQLDWLHQTTGLYQRWGVFVDIQTVMDGWLVVEARLTDGSEPDLFQGTPTVSWKKPRTPFTYYRSYRWPTPLVVISGDPRLHRWLIRALALDWQRRHPGPIVIWARVNLMREKADLAPAQRQILWEGPVEWLP